MSYADKDNLDKVSGNLLRSNVTLKEAKAIVTSKSVTTRNRSYFKFLDKMPHQQLAIVFNYCNYNSVDMIAFIIKHRKIKSSNPTRQRLKPFIEAVNKKYDLDELLEKREEQKQAIKKAEKRKDTIDSTVNGLGQVLNYFNMPSKRLREALAQIDSDGSLPKKEYINELYTLRQLFLAKAKGEIVTTQTAAHYIVELINGEVVKKRLVPRTANNEETTDSVMEVRTQSYLPDERALIAIKILDEMILQAESESEVYASESEIIEVHRQALIKSEQDRLAMIEAYQK